MSLRNRGDAVDGCGAGLELRALFDQARMRPYLA